MEILPTTSRTRPALACELRPQGVIAGKRAAGNGAAIAALSRALLPEGAFRPSLRFGNLIDRPAVVAAIRQTLEKVADRNRQITLIVPDASVRVLLLDFDMLPGKAAEALPVVRFRLKKLLPFEADDAAISYQIMSTSRSLVRVVAIAMPREVLVEYESAVREAGFEPGAVLPSTLAVLAGLPESESADLLINSGPDAVTAAIVRGGILLLHRSVDMSVSPASDPQMEVQLPPAVPAELLANPFDMSEIAAAGWPVPEPIPEFAPRGSSAFGGTALLEATASLASPPVHLPASEIVQAISVAAAYFEDTLGEPPSGFISAGTTSATQLGAMFTGTALEGAPVQEAVDPAMLPPGEGPAGMPTATPRGWIAGIQGALRG